MTPARARRPGRCRERRELGKVDEGHDRARAGVAGLLIDDVELPVGELHGLGDRLAGQACDPFETGAVAQLRALDPPPGRCGKQLDLGLVDAVDVVLRFRDELREAQAERLGQARRRGHRRLPRTALEQVDVRRRDAGAVGELVEGQSLLAPRVSNQLRDDLADYEPSFGHTARASYRACPCVSTPHGELT